MFFEFFAGGRHFTFVTDPLTYPLIAKESRKLNFRILTTPITKKIFDFQRPNADQRTADGIFPKYLQVLVLNFVFDFFDFVVSMFHITYKLF